jgi:hypothetical protein
MVALWQVAARTRFPTRSAQLTMTRPSALVTKVACSATPLLITCMATHVHAAHASAPSATGHCARVDMWLLQLGCGRPPSASPPWLMAGLGSPSPDHSRARAQAEAAGLEGTPAHSRSECNEGGFPSVVVARMRWGAMHWPMAYGCDLMPLHANGTSQVLHKLVFLASPLVALCPSISSPLSKHCYWARTCATHAFGARDRHLMLVMPLAFARALACS